MVSSGEVENLPSEQATISRTTRPALIAPNPETQPSTQVTRVETSTPRKRKLVSIYSDSEGDDHPVADKPSTRTPRAPPVASAGTANAVVHEDQPAIVAEVVQEQVIETETRVEMDVVPAPDEPEADGIHGNRHAPADQSLDDRLMNDEVLGQTEESAQQESQQTTTSNGHDPAITASGAGEEAETQLLLSDFTRAQAAARAPARTPERDSRERKHVRMDIDDDDAPLPAEVHRSPQVNRGTTRSPATRSVGRLSLPPRSPAVPFDIRPAHQGFGHRVSNVRSSMPGMVHVDIRAVELGGRTYEVVPSPASTPAVRGKSGLQEKLQSSASKRAQLLNEDVRATSPDRVYLSTKLPPFRDSPPIQQVQQAPSPRKPRSPPLRPEDRRRSILQGEEVVRRLRDEYRQNMTLLTDKYGIGAKELMRFMQEMKAKGLETIWGRVDEELGKLRG